MNDVKPTGGAWFTMAGDELPPHLRDKCFVNSENGTVIAECAFSIRSDEVQANAALIAEAGTVYNKTGRTPRQLADDVNRLRAALRDCVPYVAGAYECAFPDGAENEAVLDAARFALAATEAGHA